MFALTRNLESSSMGNRLFYKYLDSIEEIIDLSPLRFSLKDWLTYKENYLKQGIKPVHHSENYRKTEKPSYRIVSNRLMDILPLLIKINSLDNSNKSIVIAIDGRSASGKTTIVKQLEKIIGASLIHLDDFFLPSSLRTDDRLSEAGGNVHYERFMEEVLPNIRSGKSFSYNKFDCGIMDYKGKRDVKKSKYYIVEGAYSSHPKFGKYEDLLVFSDIDVQMQIERIKKRNGEELAKRFKEVWIPIEELYIEKYNVQKRADLSIVNFTKL